MRSKEAPPTGGIERLQEALGDRWALERELGHGLTSTVYLARDLEAPPTRRRQGPPPRAGRLPRQRALPPRDRDRRQSEPPPHPAALQLGRGERAALLRHALRGGRVPRGPDGAGRAPPGGRSAADRPGRGGRALLRAPARCGPPGHQAGQHSCSRPAEAVVADFGIAKAISDAGHEKHHPDRHRHRLARLHEPGAGDRRAGAGRPVRHLLAGLRGLRDADRRAACHGEHTDGGPQPPAHGRRPSARQAT